MWMDYGRDNYAGVTWSDVPQKDGRRILIIDEQLVICPKVPQKLGAVQLHFHVLSLQKLPKDTA